MTEESEELSPALAALLEGERAASDIAPKEAKLHAARALFDGPGLPAPGHTRTGQWMRRAARVAALRRALPWITFVVGAGVGGALHATLAPPPAQAPALSNRSPSPTSAMPSPTAPAAPARPESVSPESLPNATERSTAAPAPKVHAGGALDEERTWLDRARSALARGDAKAAEAALEAHRHAFANGALAEERDYLAIEVARSAGDDAKAAARSDAFRRKYPDSMLLGEPPSTNRTP